jgi:diguanylate cyclase (GGDEF)-like protein
VRAGERLTNAIRSRTLGEQPDNPKLLLIDDSQDIHMLIRQRLRSDGIDVIGAENGVDGLRLAGEEIPALILLDLGMPVMDGFEVLRTLKDDPATSQIPVIVLSGRDDAEDKVQGFDLGAIDYVCKPFDMTELRARVRSAMRIAELMRLLSQRAQIDGLTGLWNRAYFDERFEAELSSAKRSGAPISLAMCDVDHFKSLNDTHGHPAGDAVLQGFGKILTETLRRDDVACRYGGEEFAIILRNSDANAAATVIDRIRRKLAQTVWPRHPERAVTASFGICDRTTPPSEAAAAWIETADKSLYQAKTQGRNRVFIAGSGVYSPAEPARATG